MRIGQWSWFWQLLKSSCAIACYLIKKTWTCYWKGVFTPIFSFIILLAEDMKALTYKCPICNTFFFCCVWDTKSVKLSYLQQVKLWRKKFIAKTLGQANLFNNRFNFLYKAASCGSETIQNCQNLDHCLIGKKLLICR